MNLLEQLKELNLTIIETNHNIILTTLDGKIIHAYTSDVSTVTILNDATDYVKRMAHNDNN